MRELGMVDQHTPAVYLALARALEAVLQFLTQDSAALNYTIYLFMSSLLIKVCIFLFIRIIKF